MRLPSLKILFSFLLFCFYGFVSAQYNIPEKPAVLYPVYDEANLLTQQEKDALNQKLIKFSDSTSTEIEVIIIPTTKGEDINSLAINYGNNWGIGKKDMNTGVILLIAKEDRTLSIQQGKGLENLLTTSICQQILDHLITPHFKQQCWFDGINNGISGIINIVKENFN